MRNCIKCKEYIPYHVVLNEKSRNLKNRKYCLNCSPFGSHNTRQLHLEVGQKAEYEELKTEQLKCSICERIYDYHHKDPKGHTRTKCNSCLVNIRRFQLKQKCVEYKGGSCEVCGYKKCIKALVFHHKDPTQKDFGISGKHCYSWERIRTELDKCLMLCANCHAETHHELDAAKAFYFLKLNEKVGDFKIKKVCVIQNKNQADPPHVTCATSNMEDDFPCRSRNVTTDGWEHACYLDEEQIDELKNLGYEVKVI